MRTTKLFLIAVFGGLTVVSCNKKDDSGNDSTPPEVQNVLINGVSQIDTVNVGDNLQISASFSDNQELGKLKIRVDAMGQTSNWSELKHVDLSGTSQQINQNIQVMSTAKEGAYEISFEFTDASGNTADHYLPPFQVQNKSIPEILNLKSKFDNGTYDHETGDTLRLVGQVIDDEDIQLISVHVRIPPGYAAEPTFFEEKIPMNEPGDTHWDFEKDGNIKIYFPPFSKTGSYTLTVLAVDNKNNSTSKQIGIGI